MDKVVVSGIKTCGVIPVLIADYRGKGIYLLCASVFPCKIESVRASTS